MDCFFVLCRCRCRYRLLSSRTPIKTRTVDFDFNLYFNLLCYVRHEISLHSVRSVHGHIQIPVNGEQANIQCRESHTIVLCGCVFIAYACIVVCVPVHRT